MSQETKHKLPPNPYRRSPIKKREDLAGRDREQKTIRYYLSLTVSGQSPHLALIGQRGVGKTSLLNGAEAIARDLKLLPVRLDMNELKARSPGRFWHDLYQTLALSMVKAGCWGGIQGPIYAELLRMLNAPQPGSLEKAVMQVPYLFSCSQGMIDRFECPDALVVNDFEVCVSELKSIGLAGIAFLIDEADCLGKNVSLLQMFRNIFQVVEHCSLVLAGTEAVFPALSEVFSPIPRQFHRVEVKPFASWSDTMDLVLRPIPKELYDTVAPELDVVMELHELCDGAPDEVQLYCHHMYRSIEDGSSTQMTLSPQVFREVLREYRSNTPANVEAVLNAIERLPDKLLYESKWLSFSALTLEENIRVTVLQRELKLNKTLTVDERKNVADELTEGYSKLFESGIIEKNNCINLVGAPLTAGFWKSFVEVERGKRWIWNDRSFADIIGQPIMNAIGVACKAAGHLHFIETRDAEIALQSLREGRVPGDFDEGMGLMIASALFAREENITHAIDVTFRIDSPAGKQALQYRYFEKPGQELRCEQFHEWIECHLILLKGNDISIVISDLIRLELPSPAELHRLGRISRYRIPEVFGPTENEQAISLFTNGDIQGCMDIFSRMLGDKEEACIRNNLAFCQVLTGNPGIGLENVTKAIAMEYEPLYEINKGLSEFLQQNIDPAKNSLHNALNQLRVSGYKYEPNTCYVLVLESTERKISSHDLPLDVAILINLYRMGDLDKTELEKEMIKLYPDNAQNWMTAFTAT
jgi:hypothetical protein